MQKLSIVNIYEIWTGVMWSTLEISSGAQLGHDKRDIPAFETVLFHSNLSSLRRNTEVMFQQTNSIEFWAKNIKDAFKKTLLVA